MTGFPAFVLVCSNGHGEVTTHVETMGPDTWCSRCGEGLTLLRQITVPGRRHSDMGCHAALIDEGAR